MMNILLGVTGGISAYKAVDIASALRKSHNNIVRIIMTEGAKKFITPLTLATISHNPVYDDNLEWAPDGVIKHISLSDWADIFLIAPATANTIAKLANGYADNLLTSTYLAYDYHQDSEKKVYLCPAMNTRMWYDMTTQKNLYALKDKSNHIIIDPVEGLLACGTTGIGKLAPTRDIVNRIIGSDI